MTPRYEGKIRCPYCKKVTSFDYADRIWNTNYCNYCYCKYCNKEFKVKQKFIGEKLKGDD